MTDPARAQIRELIESWETMAATERSNRWCHMNDAPIWQAIHAHRADVLDACAKALREALSRLGEPEAPAPQVAERQIAKLKREYAHLEGVRLPHARKAENANGFQRGWHAALSRVREGDDIETLLSLVPEPSANVEIPVVPAESSASGWTPRRCQRHGPLPGLRYCPECASSGEPWTDAQADAADASPLVRTTQSEDQEDQTRGGTQADSEVSSPPQPPTGVLRATAPDWQPIETHGGSDDDVLVAVYDGKGRGRVTQACFDPKDQAWYEVNAFDDGWPIEQIIQPTHWMPLPAPPHKGTK